MNRLAFSIGLGFILLMLTVQYASASWVLVPNGSFESGSVGSVPDQWSMVTRNWDEHGGTTFTNDLQQIDTKYFEGAKSLWLHSRVVDTDGTRQMRDAWTEAVTEDWIDAPSATHVRVFMRDIKSTHSPFWGWCNHIFLLINNVSVAKTYSGGAWYDMLFTHGEFLSWNYYNYTATGADGQSWYVYEYSIPESVDKTHMKIQIACNAHDWSFYDASYFSDLEFVVDKVELFELIPNGSFEEGTLCTVPDSWVMKTLDYTGSPPPISTYIHEVCENDTHYFSGNRSCWLHSRVVDTDGTRRDRYSWTWIESTDWINQPSATHVRFYIRDIRPTHSLSWGWNDGIYLGFNDTVWDITNYKINIYNNGETVNIHYYNDTKIGMDGSMWYEYIYPIPSFINKSQMRVQFMCSAGDWTFYDTSYFADMSFYIDSVAFLYQPTMPSVSISPLSASIYVGESVSFTSAVSGGTLPYSYQWCLNGNPVSGATSSTWTFTPVTAGTYTVYLNVTENLGGIGKSNEASVTVAPQLTASISPMSASVLVGQSVAFTSTVSGGYSPYSYQWYLDGNPFSGATSASWTFTPMASGIYYVYLKVTDAKGNTTQSEPARIAVAPPVPVGGYSFPIRRSAKADPLIPCLALVAVSAIAFTAVKRKTKREAKS